MSDRLRALTVITGQTATGKTSLALQFAKELNGELVNFDSRQIYRHLNIVTGKDLSEINEMNIPIHMIDIVNPDQLFTSFDFVTHAKPVIEDIWRRDKTPILVGGTYLYLKHLLYGQDVTVPPNLRLRNELEKLSVKDLQKKLFLINKSVYESLNHSDLNNPRRLIRKIEITQNKNTNTPKIDGKLKVTGCRIIGLKHKSRESLVKSITKRVEKRIAQGAIDEIKKLLAMGYKKTDPGLHTIGYKQLLAYLEGKTTLEEAQQDWINKEVQYAKRQLTFMKLNQEIDWKDL